MMEPGTEIPDPEGLSRDSLIQAYKALQAEHLRISNRLKTEESKVEALSARAAIIRTFGNSEGLNDQGAEGAETVTPNDTNPDENPENESENPTGDYHPLLEFLILGNLAKFLDLKTLRAGRLVCSTWNDVFVFRLGYKCTVVPSPLGRFQCCPDHPPEYKPVLDVDNFGSTFPPPSDPDSNEMDIEAVTVRNLRVTLPGSDTHPGAIFLQSWLKDYYGGRIVDLSLTLERTFDVQQGNVLVSILSACPNLKMLRLPQPWDRIPEAQRPLLPKLKTLEVENWQHDGYDYVVPFARSLFPCAPGLSVLRIGTAFLNGRDSLDETDGPYFENLTELEIYNEMCNPDCIDILSEVNFSRLQKLKVDKYEDELYWGPYSFGLLRRVLVQVAPTLRELRLLFTINPNPQDWRDEEGRPLRVPPPLNEAGEVEVGVELKANLLGLPPLPNLRLFEYGGGVVTTYDQGSVEFVRLFPGLETLILSGKTATDRELFLNQIVHPDVDHIPPGTPKNSIQKLFPFRLLEAPGAFEHQALRTLKIPTLTLEPLEGPNWDSVGPKTVDVIRRLFPLLESLTVCVPLVESRPRDHTSSVLSGVEHLANLQELEVTCDGRGYMDDLLEWTLEYYCPPALRKFVFSCKPNRTVLKAKTVIEFVQGRNSLQVLELHGFVIKDYEKEQLLKALGHVNRVKFVNCLVSTRLEGPNNSSKQEDETWELEQSSIPLLQA